MWVVEGQENLGGYSEREAEIVQLKQWAAEMRLSCQAKVFGDVTVRRLVRDEMDVLLINAEGAKNVLGVNGREQSLAILFCDMGNFTEFAVSQLPYDVVHLLNRYYHAMGETVMANGGYIDKYLGDGLMAFFGLDGGEPADFCRQAVRASFQMQARISLLNQYAKKYFGHRF